MKTRITQSEYLQIIGILRLAEKHYRTVKECIEVLGELTGDGPDGHCADAVFCNYSAKQLLEKLNIPSPSLTDRSLRNSRR